MTSLSAIADYIDIHGKSEGEWIGDFDGEASPPACLIGAAYITSQDVDYRVFGDVYHWWTQQEYCETPIYKELVDWSLRMYDTLGIDPEDPMLVDIFGDPPNWAVCPSENWTALESGEFIAYVSDNSPTHILVEMLRI